MRETILYEVLDSHADGVRSTFIALFEHSREAVKFAAGNDFKSIREVQYFEREVCTENPMQDICLLFPPGTDPKALIPDTIIVSSTPVYNSCEHYEDAQKMILVQSGLAKLTPEERAAFKKVFKARE